MKPVDMPIRPLNSSRLLKYARFKKIIKMHADKVKMLALRMNQ